MASDFFHGVVRENGPLFSLLYRFNCQPALDIHPDHLDEVAEADLVRRLCDCPPAERRLSECLARRFDLDPGGYWEFANPRARLAALGRGQLEQLATMTGAALLHRSIGCIIEREQLRKIKQAVGEPVYLFAVKRAPFLVGSLAAEPGSAAAVPADENPRHRFDAVGLQCILECIEKFPPPLHARLRLKLPRDARLTVGQESTAEARNLKFNLVKRILLSEIDPSLAPCFN